MLSESNNTQGSYLSAFFQGAQLHLQRLLKGAMYRNKYIFGLPRENLRESQESLCTPLISSTDTLWNILSNHAQTQWG